MARRHLLAAMLGCLTLSTQAATLEFRPSSPSVAVGSPVAVDVFAVLGTGEQIGAFDITAAWSDSLLSLDSVSFDTYLDGPADSIQDVIPGTGSVSVTEVSLATLDNQIGQTEFRLFRLNLTGAAPGTSGLDFTAAVLSDALGAPLSVTSVANSLTVEAAVVPAPATGFLLATGLGLLGWRKRRGSSGSM